VRLGREAGEGIQRVERMIYKRFGNGNTRLKQKE